MKLQLSEVEAKALMRLCQKAKLPDLMIAFVICERLAAVLREPRSKE